jgi:hypothetical protein
VEITANAMNAKTEEVARKERNIVYNNKCLTTKNRKVNEPNYNNTTNSMQQ